MKIEGYPVRKINNETGSMEQEPNVPIIDFIRHGETDYKYGQLNNWKGQSLDTNVSGFRLDSENLDLTPEGISTMQNTARELVGMIDKEKEAVLIISSPSPRAHSSALIVEKELRNNGLNILNREGEFKFSQSLNESGSRFKKITEKDERRESEAIIFHRFLRKMNNIYDYLKPETLDKLKGKRLRIICITHAEITRDFIRETFNLAPEEKAQKNSQIFEIKPQSQLRKSEEPVTDIKLFRTAKHPGNKEARIARGFKPSMKK